jgi:FO synthase
MSELSYESLRVAASASLETIESRPIDELFAEARQLRAQAHGSTISFSKKVFIPLTQLCQDTCAYCTFAKTPRGLHAAYLTAEEVLDIAAAGKRAGCHEALFTLGDKPELRYSAARDFLAKHGFRSTTEYLIAMCDLVIRKTGLLPHVNAGVMSEAEILALRSVSVSQGIMLECVSERLCERGQAHFGSPDKHPKVRLEMIAAAGRLAVPFTSGILIGIGETRLERVASLLALRELNSKYGHIQEVIVQNFRAKPDTKMAKFPEPSLDELKWTIAAARLLLGPNMNIQAPPNLSNDDFGQLLDCGINDWGGVSPVTLDHVNPEAPWPAIPRLERATTTVGLNLAPRLAIYPEYLLEASRWLDRGMHRAALQFSDSEGFARDSEWSPGVTTPVPASLPRRSRHASRDVTVARAISGDRLTEREITSLFSARGEEFEEILSAADDLRESASGNTVRYVVNRNINYTNVCTYRCRFCAFSKGKTNENLRGKPYDLSEAEIRRRALEAWTRGATEVCMQGGINPHYTGETYLSILRMVKDEVPGLHVHAFSPLEVTQGAATLGISARRFLETLRDAGLGSLPGTAAEILDDGVREVLCPDKLGSAEWLETVATAHSVGLKTTATIMFGHVEKPVHWARHLLAIRDLQERTRGFTEFVPLPFVHMEAPLGLKGETRLGPSWREVRLMHAVARLVLHPLITNIQASWVKLGPDGVRALLSGGVNDLGGTLMNESISRAAGTQHGQELEPALMESLIASASRVPEQRTTLYGPVPDQQRAASFRALPLMDVIQTPYKAHKQTLGQVAI